MRLRRVGCQKSTCQDVMISSMENIVEVTPTSPPSTLPPSTQDMMQDLEEDSNPGSPEIRVTDSPVSTASSPGEQNSRSSPVSNTSNSAVAAAPLIFQPFLPLPVTRALPFSIDNILKPTFGGVQAPNVQNSRTAAAAAAQFLHNPFFSTLAAAQQMAQQQHQAAISGLAGLAAHQAQVPKSPKLHHQSLENNNNRQRSPSSSSSSNGSLVKSELKSPPASPLNHNNNQPVDLSSKTPQNGTSNGGSGGDSKNAKDPDQEGVPPGMVRGPNGQLWPAWVFCTRYSDRPSSGKRKIN